MRKILILLLCAFMACGTFAQVQRKVAPTNKIADSTLNEEGDSTNKFEGRAKLKAMKELNLTKEQKSKLKEMRQANQSKKEEIINDGSLTEDQKQEKLKQIKRAAAMNLQGILSDEQKTKLKAMRKEKRNNGDD
ncbi:MAG: hypothetical protein ABIQ31_04750 [Ferruginibacter sp.]